MRKRMRDFAQEVACLGDTKHKENEPPVTITDSSVKKAIGEPDNAAEPTTDNPEMVIDGAAESVIAGLAEPGTAGGAEPLTGGAAEPTTQFNPAA